jgi:hypothetical protein
MKAGMFMLLFSGDGAAEEPVCDDLKRNMVALEIFLQDQDDYEKYCPKIKWEQPNISIYKKELKSQLPEGCKDEN